MTTRFYNRITEIIAALFILLFVYTAASKLAHLSAFRYTIMRSPFIGHYASLVSWALPVLELFIASLLFFPWLRRIGLWSSFFLMIIFTDYIAAMIYFTPELPCSCGGVLRQMTWNEHLIFNCFFTLLAGVGLWTERRSV